MSNMRRGLALTAVLLSVFIIPGALVAQENGAAAARKVNLSASDAFEKGMEASLVRWDAPGNGVVLYDRVLIEDDGPGISSDSKWIKEGKAPVAEIAGNSCVRKILHVERPQALEARLYVPRGVSVTVNGTAVETPSNTKYPQIPLALLKKGDNEVILRSTDDETRTLKIARRADILLDAPERKDQPERSFDSTDGGRTWQPIDGELMIRLHLIQHAPTGSFASPVIEMGDPDRFLNGSIPNARLALTWEGEAPPKTAVNFAVRTGTTPVYDDATWSDWRALDAPAPAARRYVQWKAMLTSADPTVTPILRSVTLQITAPEVFPDWAGKVDVAGLHNEEIVYTSLPFAYEDMRHPKLVALRKNYKLDEVVAAAKSEFEAMVKLRDWVAHRWKYDPPTEYYPQWDANDILEHKVGFCVQYAITYLQVCQSMGYQARFVFGSHPGLGMSGHEVTEVWSNQYKKWVFMDPNGNRHHLDPKTGVPLSMMEIQERMIRTYYGEQGEASYANRPKEPAWAPDIATCRRLEMTPSSPPVPSEKKPERWRPWTKWLMIRYMPRNNFLSQPRLMPRKQGMTWDWTEYICWEGPRIPKDWKYRYFTGRRADLAWTLDQVRFDAAYGARPGSITVQMGTVTPGFETFLVNVDGKGWTPSGAAFDWTLKAGRNRIEMRVRNVLGILGPVSHLDLTYGG